MFADQTSAFIGVGSNIDPEENAVEAITRLQQRVRVLATSTFYWTSPIGESGQPRFLNGVWRIETSLGARVLKFDVLRGIEPALGRVRTTDKYAPRTIDLDVLLYGDRVINEPDLCIPDPDIRSRGFLAVALLELAPGLAMPDTGETLESLIDPSLRANLEEARDITRQLRELIRRQSPP